ncbi:MULTISPECIES: DUF7882 family protein [unclassified Leifsonia]|uniref:DUF7882 family protein n=1 Tax=unclassified Leifsonia TaxID=2663824 RepID=UPI000B08B319|nr:MULTISPECIES: ATP-dependent DNA ligase [unclassified Leifsonia]
MGYLSYDSMCRTRFDDRVLFHLQIVISTKLRRRESFHLSWTHSPAEGSGRTSIWLNPAIPLIFEFERTRQQVINPRWLEEMMTIADTVNGLWPIPEPDSNTRPEQPPLAAQLTSAPGQLTTTTGQRTG